MKIFKHLLILTLVTLFNLANASELNTDLIFNKSKNYITASKIYGSTLRQITRNSPNFCETSQLSLKAINNIFEEDQKLIDHLNESQEDHVRAYAKHLNENKISDYIFFNGIVKKCQQGSHLPITKFKESTERALLNIQFLQIYHSEFIQSLDL